MVCSQVAMLVGSVHMFWLVQMAGLAQPYLHMQPLFQVGLLHKLSGIHWRQAPSAPFLMCITC